ncbi:MAG: hypothetical protein IJP82_09845 [Bacteroidaceae bacterium]|nr:hypothetical protein [Bacteroidaceae bacterium]
MKKDGTNIRERLLIGTMCLSVFCLLLAAPAPPDDKSRKKSSEEVKLIHSDVLYKNQQDVHADVLVGHVKLYHDGMYLDCDSARFYKDDNTFNAYGHVKMVQGDTLTLTSDTLLYNGTMMQAHAQGNAVLIHRKTKLMTSVIDYDRLEGVGFYPQHGTLYDEDNVLDSDYGQYTPSLNEAIFKDNVMVENPKFELKTNELFYYTNTKVAKIVSETNIISTDSTFVYAVRGDYDTQTGQASLMDRSHVYKDMRDIVGDSLYADDERGVSEAFGNVVLTDVENKCMLTGNYCRYEDSLGVAVATDSAVCYEFSGPDTLYIHGDTLRMVTYHQKTDSVYHDLFAYHKVRMFRNDFQGVCDSLVTHELDSCTYLYGQPILWNEGQQVFGEEIRVYNNDSTVDWIHIINQAMTIEQLDSVSYNQVSSKEMFCYFVNGVMEHNNAKGNVYVCYYMVESDGNRIGMNYTETPEMNLYMENKKVHKIWMSTPSGTMYPPFAIPEDKRYLAGFGWFDYIRPKDKDDIFDWKEKPKGQVLQKTEQKFVPKQRLEDL